VARLVASVIVVVRKASDVCTVARKASGVRTAVSAHEDYASEQAWVQAGRRHTTTPDESGGGEKIRRESGEKKIRRDTCGCSERVMNGKRKCVGA
jgi:hypothetical protein